MAFRHPAALALAFTVLAGAAVPAHASLSSCVAGLKSQAKRAGVKSALVEQALSNVKFDEKVVRFSRTQPEFKTPIWDYMTFLVDPERIADGQANLQEARQHTCSRGTQVRHRPAHHRSPLGH
jgi:membrane-bound lytic murein transglycosylase B